MFPILTSRRKFLKNLQIMAKNFAYGEIRTEKVLVNAIIEGAVFWIIYGV